jgi:ribosomal protein L14E/L6E/L27E
VKLTIGTVVKAKAGRDCGGLFAVVALGSGCCFIADGKSRKLAKPKRKNMKHLCATGSMISIDDITDKRLRTELRRLSEAEL